MSGRGGRVGGGICRRSSGTGWEDRRWLKAQIPVQSTSTFNKGKSKRYTYVSIVIKGLICHRVQEIIVLLFQSTWVLEEIGKTISIQVTKGTIKVIIVECCKLFRNMKFKFFIQATQLEIG